MAAISFVSETSDFGGAGTDHLTMLAPSGIADDDILFGWISLSGYQAITPPSGFTLISENSSGRWYALYYKIASSESGSYTFSWASGIPSAYGHVAVFRGGFKVSDPIDNYSDTDYTTADTILRAASFTVAKVDSPLLFFGYCNSVTFTPPTNPGSFTEDWDNTDTNMTGAHYTWSAGSGATGNIDGTLSSTQTAKHAMAVALNPEPIDTLDQPQPLRVDAELQTVELMMDTIDTVQALSMTPGMSGSVGEALPSNLSGTLRGFRLFNGHALGQRDHDDYES